ncbi:MAG: MFS transporter [Acidobacteriota bacterium]|nr:MFS transporter [Acidobacteriota bacterium]
MSEAKPTNVRWWIVAMLTGFAFVSYLQRINISVAAEMMGPELHLSKIQIGQIFSSFLVGYAIFQIPGGMFADRFGTRITLAISAALWGVFTVFTGMVPSLASTATGAIFLALWLSRFFLGSAEATTYPVGALAVHNWIRPPGRAYANSWMFAGTSLAAAFATPFVSWLMLRMGWRWVFGITSLPAFVVALLWWRFSTNTPRQHRYINSAELAITNSDCEPVHRTQGFGTLLRDRKIVLLCISYMAEGYLLFIFVFWLYIYLVEVRRFSMMNGGIIAALPWLTGLAFTPLGGLVADRIAARRGRLLAAKYIIITGYFISGVLLFAAAYARTSGLCVAALCLSVGFLMSAEASFWVSATYIAGERAGAISGLMNTAGIVGGIASTSLVPVLVAHFNWLAAFGSATLVALACGSLWIIIAKQPGNEPLDQIAPNFPTLRKGPSTL